MSQLARQRAAEARASFISAHAKSERAVGVVWRIRQRRYGRLAPSMSVGSGVPNRALRCEVVRDTGHTHFVRLSGELDLATVDQAVRFLEAIAGSVVVADLTGVTFLDATGPGALLRAKRTIENAGHRLELRNASPRARLVFELCGLRELLDER